MKKTFFIRKVTRAALVLTLALAVTDASFVLTASADDTNSNDEAGWRGTCATHIGVDLPTE